LVCRKCGSENVQIQAVNKIKLKTQHKGILWWILIGWWWVFFKWLFLTIPALFFKIFSHKKQRAVNKVVSVAQCQTCGARWEVRKIAIE